MKIDKLFAVLVLGGGVMAGCGGQPSTVPEAPADDAPAEDAPAATDEAPASAPTDAAADGKDGKCAWY